MGLRPEWDDCNVGVDKALAIIVPTCYFISAILFLLVGFIMKDVVVKDEPAVVTEEESKGEHVGESNQAYQNDNIDNGM